MGMEVVIRMLESRMGMGLQMEVGMGYRDGVGNRNGVADGGGDGSSDGDVEGRDATNFFFPLIPIIILSPLEVWGCGKAVGRGMQSTCPL